MTVKIVELKDALGEPAVFTKGVGFAIVATITRNGATFDITGATVTASVIEADHGKKLITGHSVTITTAASGIVTLTVTNDESASLSAPPLGKLPDTTIHYSDFKVVIAGTTTQTDPISFRVREGIT